MRDESANQSECPICGHEYGKTEMTRHHLVPKSRKGRVTVSICRSCHRQVHALYTEKELEQRFDTLDKLVAAEEMQRWIRWIRKRRPNGRLRTRSSKRKGRAR